MCLISLLVLVLVNSVVKYPQSVLLLLLILLEHYDKVGKVLIALVPLHLFNFVYKCTMTLLFLKSSPEALKLIRPLWKMTEHREACLQLVYMKSLW